MPSQPFRLANVATFQALSAGELALLEAQLEPIPVTRGTCIVREGEAADALFVVVSGRFAVEISGATEPVTEIGQGATIGEIAFFAGGARTATVRAIRDSVVVRLTRADFDVISSSSPALWQTITATLASRLAAETRTSTALRQRARDMPRAGPRPRTLALIRAGGAEIPKPFLDAFACAARDTPGTLVVTSQTISEYVANSHAASAATTEALNDLEQRYSTIVFIADEKLTPWSEKAIRQADAILGVGTHPEGPLGSAVALNPLEQFAATLHTPAAHRLVLVHPRSGAVQGTRHWLAQRAPSMHHHVALADKNDIGRLWRFLRGDALGFVACGGGAYCAAHIGVYQAFREHGPDLDYFGGTSGGAAMAAAFAQDIVPADLDARVHRMFIDGKALGHYTLPRYSLLDHTHFDAHLINEYGNVRIEDLWKPYFAVSADLSSGAVEVHRNGPVWQAIRASAAIPGLLPPYYSADGRMLVDGSVIANVPIEVMHALKNGPNVVVSFNMREGERFNIDYDALPARRQLLWRMLNPFATSVLPDAPSAATVLVRSLMANRGRFEQHLAPEDWLLVPPTPENMGALDWRRHTELVHAAFLYTSEQIKLRSTMGGPRVNGPATEL
ncbi:MAG: cyclic nucleotide-binding and patatin-like phospholipase domain-containing protein [Hyphomicrobium sp.]